MVDIPGYAVVTDFASVQDALDSDPGMLYFPPGSHSAGTGATLNRSKILIGSRNAGTNDTLVTSTGSFVFQVAAGADYCVFMDMELSPASGGFGVEFGASEGHYMNMVHIPGGGNQGWFKATGVLKKSRFNSVGGIFPGAGRTIPLVDLGGFEHESLVIGIPSGDAEAAGPDSVVISGKAIRLRSGGFDSIPDTTWMIRADSPTMGSVIWGGDYESGDGGFLKAVGADTMVLVSGTVYNTNATPSSAVAMLRAETGAKIVPVGSKRIGSTDYTTFASTDGDADSAVIMLEPSESGGGVSAPDGLLQGASGNVKVLYDGAWSP